MNSSTASEPSSTIPAYRHPSNWRFCTLLRQVREKRKFTSEEACKCLPAVSLKRYRQWERGSQIPLDVIQTLAIWRLNTSPQPRAVVDRLTLTASNHGNALISGLPATVIAIAAAAVGAGAYHMIQAKSSKLSLESTIEQSASLALRYRVPTSAYRAYSADLRSTLTQLDGGQKKRIFGEMKVSVAPLLE